MRVVITKNSKGIGTRGEVKTVSGGFFRNFLQPNSLAVAATKGVMKDWEHRHSKELKLKEEVTAHAKEYAEKLEGSNVKVTKKMTDKETYYAAISAEEVCEAIKKQAKVEVTPSQVEFDEHIKKPGHYPVKLNLSDSVSVTVTVDAH